MPDLDQRYVSSHGAPPNGLMGGLAALCQTTPRSGGTFPTRFRRNPARSTPTCRFPEQTRERLAPARPLRDAPVKTPSVPLANERIRLACKLPANALFTKP